MAGLFLVCMEYIVFESRVLYVVSILFLTTHIEFIYTKFNQRSSV